MPINGNFRVYCPLLYNRMWSNTYIWNAKVNIEDENVHPANVKLGAIFFACSLACCNQIKVSVASHKRWHFNNAVLWWSLFFLGPGSLPGYPRRGPGGYDDGASDISSTSGFSAFGYRSGQLHLYFVLFQALYQNTLPLYLRFLKSMVATYLKSLMSATLGQQSLVFSSFSSEGITFSFLALNNKLRVLEESW